MKRDFLWKVLEIAVPDMVSAAVFMLIYSCFKGNWVVQRYGWASAVLVLGYMAYENVKTVKDKEAVGQGA